MLASFFLSRGHIILFYIIHLRRSLSSPPITPIGLSLKNNLFAAVTLLIIFQVGR